MPPSLTAKVQPRTPLWTGDANEDARKRGGAVRETGILGSLRWWYEAMIRGLGGCACDPTAKPCEYDRRAGLDSICHACRLFGCTGRARRFRLRVSGGGDAGELVSVRHEDSIKYVHQKSGGKRKHLGWRIPPNVVAPVTINILPMHAQGLSRFEKTALYLTMELIQRYGALGAKTSHGQGVVEVSWQERGEMNVREWLDTATVKSVRDTPQAGPSLADFLGAEIRWDRPPDDGWRKVLQRVLQLNGFPLNGDSSWVPSAPAIRAQLRSWLRDPVNIPGFAGDSKQLTDGRHRLMGTTGGKAKGSDIFVSHFYKDGERWRMRIFAFVKRDDDVINRATRALLTDPQRLAGVISTALGGVASVDVQRYPSDVAELITGPQGEPA